MFFFFFVRRTAVSAAKLDSQLCGPVDCDPIVEPAEHPWRQDRYRVQGDVRHVRSVRCIHAQQREYPQTYENIYYILSLRVIYIYTYIYIFTHTRTYHNMICIICTLLDHLYLNFVSYRFFVFFFTQEVFNDTKITISGLSPVTTYKFHVWAENGVSNLTSSENRQFVDIAVTTTEASVKSASVNNVRVMLVKASEIALSWDPPSINFLDSGDDDVVEVYEVSR